MKLGEVFPDFKALTNKGTINSFHSWMGEGNWAILFSHPADFTPVCTTELARAALLAQEFFNRKVKMLALSCDSVGDHQKWIPDICEYAKELGLDKEAKADYFPFEIIADESRQLAAHLDMLDPDEVGRDGQPLTARAVFIISPKKTLKAMILYPSTTGRDFHEILRVVDSLQLAAHQPVATPEGWHPKDDCMVQPNVTNERAKEIFGDFKTKKLPSGKDYLRFTHQPQTA